MGTSAQSSRDFSSKSRKSYCLKTSAYLSLASHLNSTQPEESQLSAPSFSSDWSLTSNPNTSDRSGDSKSKASAYPRKGNRSADVSDVGKAMDTCRLASPGLTKYNSTSRLGSRASDSDRYKSGEIDTSYLDSFDIDFDREMRHLKRDHSQSMFSINSSFHPNLNSTEVSQYRSSTSQLETRSSSTRVGGGVVCANDDLMICGDCKSLFTSLPLFLKHRKKNACQRPPSCHCHK